MLRSRFTSRSWCWVSSLAGVLLLASAGFGGADESAEKATVQLSAGDEVAAVPGEPIRVELAVRSTVPLAGVQATVRYDARGLIPGDPKLTERSAHMTVTHAVSEGKMILLVYSPEARKIPPGDGPVLDLCFTRTAGTRGLDEVRVENVILASPEAEAIPVVVRSSAISVGARTPTSCRLVQNYPNPFNPETAVGYELPEEGYVSLTIFNLLGQEVCRLVDGQQEAGSYRVVWDGRNSKGEHVSGGVYFCVLTAGHTTATTKMLLLR